MIICPGINYPTLWTLYYNRLIVFIIIRQTKPPVQKEMAVYMVLLSSPNDTPSHVQIFLSWFYIVQTQTHMCPVWPCVHVCVWIYQRHTKSCTDFFKLISHCSNTDTHVPQCDHACMCVCVCVCVWIYYILSMFNVQNT